MLPCNSPLLERLDPEREIKQLALYDDGESHGAWKRIVRRNIMSRVRALHVSQCFGGDSLGAALLASKLRELEHLELSVEGYEAYCDPLGLREGSRINKPKLRTLAFSYYPLFPGVVSALRKASMPALEAACLTLVSMGGVRELLSAKWFSQLHTLQLRLSDEPHDNGDDYEHWLRHHVEDYLPLSPDGCTRIDRDIRALATHPHSAGLRRLAIELDFSRITMAAIEALRDATHLRALEILWLPAAFDAPAEDIRAALLSSPNLPNLREVDLSHAPRMAWRRWTIERDGVQQPLALSRQTLIDSSDPGS